ncbi:MFS transporter [Chlorobium sp.]|uniref:MFS transporter n=1 Tax=Chlorobium sp. TaxID=1095 RepID=UPI003C3A0D0C
MHPPPSPAGEPAAYRKAAWRLVPFLFFCYILAYLDRVNVGFAKLQMSRDLGLGDIAYGTGAGIFFIGYLLFEVPSNIILSKVGARIWIARIMITWGIVASLQLFVSDEHAFYLLRFLLGVAEAGFFPGIILYLTIWFPSEYRARMVAWFMTAVAIAGVVGGPVSGAILEAMDGFGGLQGWQWLFVLEGLPSAAMGVVVLFYLDDSPRDASWLDTEEKDLLMRRAALDGERRLGGAEEHTAGYAMKNPKVWGFSGVYFLVVMGLYGISFWLPQIIGDTITSDERAIGWISAIPWLAAAVAMVLNGVHSDRSGERRWHVAAPCLVAATAFALSAMPQSGGWYGIVALSVATAGIMSALSCFWSLPSSMLGGTAAAAGIAVINSFGNIAGYVSPELAGRIRESAGDRMEPVLAMFSLSLLLAAFATLAVTPVKQPQSNTRYQ